MNRRLAAIGFATLTGVLTAVPSAGRADAASTVTPAISVNCLQIGRTFRSGDTIIGYGSLSCPKDQYPVWLTIERSDFWEGWVIEQQVYVTGPGYDQYLGFNCSGSGSHDWHTVIHGKNNGWTVSKISNQITEDCG